MDSKTPLKVKLATPVPSSYDAITGKKIQEGTEQSGDVHAVEFLLIFALRLAEDIVVVLGKFHSHCIG